MNRPLPWSVLLRWASVDRAAISSGIDGYQLMEIAGAALAACVLKHYPHAQNAVVLCGPGNNGGDGYVAARHLHAAGLPVAVHSLVDVAKLAGDAAKARDEWTGPISALNAMTLPEGSVVVDALFGGGLDRAIEGNAAATINAINLAGVPVVAADLPSGISGRSGEIFGTALQADHTVTFVAPKPGHYLLPGADHCGALHVIDIGIPGRFIEALQVTTWRNDPAIWRAFTAPCATGRSQILPWPPWRFQRRICQHGSCPFGSFGRPEGWRRSRHHPGAGVCGRGQCRSPDGGDVAQDR